MKRKVNRVGTNTLTVSLPSKWIENNNITKGQELNLEFDNDKLIISQNEIKHKKKSLEIEINDYLFVYSYLRRAYRLGYTDLIIRCSKENVLKRAKEIISNLLGAEIIDQTNNYLRIFISDPDVEMKFETEMVKCLRLVKIQLEYILLKIKKNQNIEKEEIFSNYYSVIKRIEYFLRKNTLDNENRIQKYTKISLLNNLHELQRQIGYYFVLSKENINLFPIKNSQQVENSWKEFLKFIDDTISLLQKNKQVDIDLRKNIQKLQHNLINNSFKVEDIKMHMILFKLIDSFDKFNELLVIYKNESMMK